VSCWSLLELRDQNPPVLDERVVIARTGAVSLRLVETPGDHTPGTTAGTLEGTFAAFDTWTEIADGSGRYLERIAPGAFRKTISETGRRLPVLLDHGKSSVLGSLPIGRLDALSETADGANYTVTLNAGLPELLIAGLKDGQYGSSFRATALQSRVNRRPEPSAHNPNRLPEVVRLELRLIDIGPTSMPAYATTTAKVRSSAAQEESAATPSSTRPQWMLADPTDDSREPPYWTLRRGDEQTLKEPAWKLRRREEVVQRGCTYAVSN
jgi:phage head maturation protease